MKLALQVSNKYVQIVEARYNTPSKNIVPSVDRKLNVDSAHFFIDVVKENGKKNKYEKAQNQIMVSSFWILTMA